MPLGCQFSGSVVLGGVLARSLTARAVVDGRSEVWSHSSGVESLPSCARPWVQSYAPTLTVRLPRPEKLRSWAVIGSAFFHSLP